MESDFDDPAPILEDLGESNAIDSEATPLGNIENSNPMENEENGKTKEKIQTGERRRNQKLGRPSFRF